jgi:hypothetical protein
MPEPDIEPPFICADCERPVTRTRRGWADSESRPPWGGGGVHYTCREHIVTMPDGGLVLEAADYHYVAGETQRHFDRSSSG